jgi:ABC-type glycerol-3-phosphate transport system substrate-binding protein
VSLGDWESAEIGVFDPETGDYEKKMDIDVYGYFGLQYNGEIDAHYMCRAGEIIKSVALGEWETAVYMPITNFISLPSVLLPGGYFAVSLQDNIRVRNIDPQYLPERPLKLNNTQWEDLTIMFARANPDVPMAYIDVYFNNVEQIAASMSGPDAADIYTIDSSGIDLEALFKKGYLADLSGNQAITEIVNRMYLNIRESLTFDGNITAIPYNMNASTFGVNLKTLEEIGLTEDDAPKTYYELLEFIEPWINEYSVDYPDLKLFEDSDNIKNQLVGNILSAQISYCGAQNEPLTFDTPVMRKLLAKLESIDFTPLSENISFDDEGTGRQWPVAFAFNGSEGSAPLFNFYTTITCERYRIYTNWEFKPTPLALDEGMPAIVDAQMGLLVLNQKSADNEEAMRFMQYCAENMYPTTRINTIPDENEPIESSVYFRNLEFYQKQLGILESLLEIADEDTKPFIETDIQSYKEPMEDNERQKWSTTPEDIARYRSLYDYVSITKANLLFSRYNEEITTIINRYLDRQIKSDQFIMELSRKLRMMQMEG